MFSAMEQVGAGWASGGGERYVVGRPTWGLTVEVFVRADADHDVAMEAAIRFDPAQTR